MRVQFEHLDNKLPRVWKHILFWVIYVLFFGLLWGSFDDAYGREISAQLLMLPPKLVATYVTLYVLLPKFLLKEQYLGFFIYLALLLLLSGFFHWVMAIYLEQPIFHPNDYWGTIWYPAKILKNMTGIYPVVAIAVVVKLMKIWYKDQRATQQLAKEKLEAELKFLKAQIHPHFLFNTLNNLYALTLKKSNNAPEVVLKLSDLLNYMLYECNAPKVPIGKEIELVKNYISLERIRYDNRLEISLNITGELESKEIAPMLILPFVENSFKHGVSGEIDQAWVSIDISLKDSLMTLKVENSKSTNGAKDEHDYKEGIGLKNVKRRLDLLYPNRYEFKTFDTEDAYMVVLKLSLDESLSAVA